MPRLTRAVPVTGWVGSLVSDTAERSSATWELAFTTDATRELDRARRPIAPPVAWTTRACCPVDLGPVALSDLGTDPRHSSGSVPESARPRHRPRGRTRSARSGGRAVSRARASGTGSGDRERGVVDVEDAGSSCRRASRSSRTSGRPRAPACRGPGRCAPAGPGRAAGWPPPPRPPAGSAGRQRHRAQLPGQVVLGRLALVGAGVQGDPRRRVQLRDQAFLGQHGGRGRPAHQVGVERPRRRRGPRVQPVDPGGGPGQVRREEHDDRHDANHHHMRGIVVPNRETLGLHPCVAVPTPRRRTRPSVASIAVAYTSSTCAGHHRPVVTGRPPRARTPTARPAPAGSSSSAPRARASAVRVADREQRARPARRRAPAGTRRGRWPRPACRPPSPR